MPAGEHTVRGIAREASLSQLRPDAGHSLLRSAARRTLLVLTVAGCLAVLACASGRGAAARPVTGPDDGHVARSDAPERRILVTIEQRRSEPLRSAGSTSRHYVGPSAYTVTQRTRRVVARIVRERGLREVDGWPIRPLGVHCVVFEVPEPLSVNDTIENLRKDPRIESVQRMHTFDVQSRDDPYAGLQHGLDAMRVHEAHSWAGGNGVTVAVIDTGVDRSHPDLTGSIALARDFVDENNGEDVVIEFHGTAVAGIIASVPDNGIGTVGVAPGSRLMTLRACWEPSEAKSSGTCDTFTLSKALAFVAERGPDILNLSLSGPADPLLERLASLVLERGTVIVTAFEDGGDGPRFPGSVDGVVVVQSTGARSGGLSGQLLRAPGREILTTTPGAGFDFVSGNSFAAAHVSGVVALLLERAPDLGPRRIHELLLETSRRTEETGGDAGQTVDACAALAELVAGVSCEHVAEVGSGSGTANSGSR